MTTGLKMLSQIIAEYMQEQGHNCTAQNGEVLFNDQATLAAIERPFIMTNKAAACVTAIMCKRKKWIDMHRPDSLHALLESYKECDTKGCKNCENLITFERIAAILTAAAAKATEAMRATTYLVQHVFEESAKVDN
jgi:hypothetical protein